MNSSNLKKGGMKKREDQRGVESLSKEKIKGRRSPVLQRITKRERRKRIDPDHQKTGTQRFAPGCERKGRRTRDQGVSSLRKINPPVPSKEELERGLEKTGTFARFHVSKGHWGSGCGLAPIRTYKLAVLPFS